MDSRYRVSLEKQVEWLRWSRGPASVDVWQLLVEDGQRHGQLAAVRGQEQAAFEAILERGTLFHVTDHFCQLVDYARKTFSDDTLFDQRWVLAPYGFVWLDEPFEMPLIRGQLAANSEPFRLVGRAIGWEPIETGTSIVTATDDGKRKIIEAPPGTYRFVVFQEGSAARLRDAAGEPRVLLPHPISSVGYWPLAYFYLTDGSKLSDRLAEFEGVTQLQDQAGAYLPAPGETWRHEIRYVYTLLQLMSQRVAVVRDTELDRPARRGFERRGLAAPTHLKAIVLRRERDYETRQANPEGSPTRHVTVQFVVQGFWRHFPYHAACDDCVSRRAGCGKHESIWIEPFTKGPPGAPFKDNDQRVVFVARR